MIRNTGWYRNVVTGTGQRATSYSSKTWENNGLQFVRGTRNNARTKRMATHVSRGHSTSRFGGGPTQFCVSAGLCKVVLSAARSTDMLQASPQATENDASRWDIFSSLLCTSRFPRTKRFTRCPSDNPFSLLTSRELLQKTQQEVSKLTSNCAVNVPHERYSDRAQSKTCVFS